MSIRVVLSVALLFAAVQAEQGKAPARKLNPRLVDIEPKLLDRPGQARRSRHYSRRTEQTYCHWVKGVE